MALIWKKKRTIFDLLFTWGKSFKKFLQHISHSHTYTYFAHPIDFFCLVNFEKKIRIYQVRFLFGMSPGVDSYSRHTINKWQNGEQNLIKLECLLLICTYTWDMYTWRDRKHLFIPVVCSDPGLVPLWYVNVSILSCVLWTLSGLSAIRTNCAAGGARNNEPDFANKSGHFQVFV